jgi:hypothetical protein
MFNNKIVVQILRIFLTPKGKEPTCVYILPEKHFEFKCFF